MILDCKQNIQLPEYAAYVSRNRKSTDTDPNSLQEKIYDSVDEHLVSAKATETERAIPDFKDRT